MSTDGGIAAYRARAANRHAEWLKHGNSNPTLQNSNPTLQNSNPTLQNSNPTLRNETQLVDPSASAEQRYIYVLLCSEGKYYIGETRNVSERFAQHLSSRLLSTAQDSKHSGTGSDNTAIPGAAWTRRYEPIEVINSFVKRSVHDEDNTTLDYMIEHGIRNVRGGSFCTVHLPKHIRKTIKQRLATIAKLCYRCKKPGHCASACPEPPSSRRSWIDCDSEEDEAANKSANKSTAETKDAADAMFSFDASGEPSVPPPLAQSAPERLVEPLPPILIRRPVLPSMQANTVCNRCGRNNHSQNQCFAKHHLRGHVLPQK